MNVKTIATHFEENIVSDELLGKIFNSPELTIWYRDLVKDSLWVSKGYASIYGYTQNDFKRSPMIWKDAVYIEDKLIMEEAIRQLLSGKPTVVEYRIIRTDGEVRWIQDRANPILDDAGKVTGMSGSIYDITSQKETEIKLVESENRYRSLVEVSPEAIIVHQEGKIVFANPAAKEGLGAEREEQLIGKDILSIVQPDSKQVLKNRFDEVLQKGHAGPNECKLLTIDGNVIYVEASGTKIIFNGQPAIMAVGRDITEKKKLLEMLELNDQRYKSLFEHNANSVYSFDLNGYFTSCNTICERLTGYNQAEILKPMHFSSLIVPKMLERAMYHFDQCKKGIPQNFRTSFQSRNGTVMHLNVTIVPIFVNGQINGVFGIAQDITKQMTVEKANEQMAYYDYLTGLPNRNHLHSSLSREILDAREKKQNIAVLFMDLDRFKVINDNLGHNTGDQLLKEVAIRIKSFLDVEDILFRQGGDEFIVILKDSDRNTATKVCRRILDALSAPFKIQNVDFFTSSSIGISIFPDDGETVETLIKHADFAMYQAKRDGKNNYKFYSSTNQESKVNPLKLEMDLHKAIQQDELILHYQPKVSLKTGKIVGVEALIRWNHPQLGLVPPRTFIPIAEETGLIIPLGEWALYTACKQNKEWQQKGFRTIVSVNLSPRQFTQSNLDETINRILLDTKLEPKYLELEITESMTANIERTITTLQNLKKLGVRISIDDFGTGFSSLNYLQKFPINALKIDQSFIRKLQNSPNDETIIKAIISMAHKLNLSVVAEGIETKEQLVFLQQHLCDEGQGFLLSRPITAKKLEAKIFDIQKVVKEVGISQDVNERMWSEELVRLARKELNETIRLQQGMIFKFKKINGYFIHTLCDGDLLYRLGLIPSQVVGKQLIDFLPEDIANEKHLYYQRAWNGEENVSYENESNGVYYLAALSPIKRGGEVIEVIGSCIDITDRKMAESALRESENKYRLIAENMTDIIILFDINGYSIYASPSHESVLGYSPTYFEGNNTLHLIHPEDLYIVKMQFEEIIRTKSPTKVEFRLLHANGDWKLFECTGTPVMGENGEVEHIMAVGKDISEIRKAEELLWKSEKLSLVGELAAGVAHEIRNPLTSIKGFIQLFQQGFVKREYFNVILAEFDRIEDIIKEFLSLAKPQEIQLKRVNISTLIKEVETLLDSEVNLKGAEFIIEIKPDIPPIMCDPNQIKQVLINLCKNSIESFDRNRKGVIKIIVDLNNQDQLLIKIIDNGIGISEERLKKLGEPFYSNKEKGTGLGLMLCYRIIKGHNGTITFESIEQQGTTANITLPIEM